MFPDLSPIWEDEWKSIVLIEYLTPKPKCFNRFEKDCYCQRDAKHEGDHAALAVPETESHTFKDWTIKKRWKNEDR